MYVCEKGGLFMQNELRTIPIPIKNKRHHGKCIICEKEEPFVTNLVIFPSGNFAHLMCYPIEIKIH